jgi:hypothetical protein
MSTFQAWEFVHHVRKLLVGDEIRVLGFVVGPQRGESRVLCAWNCRG